MNNKEKTTIILKPDEYLTASEVDPIIIPEATFLITNGIVITKDGQNLPIQTPFPVDSGCEIQVTYNEKNIGRVKYLKSTPRRKYYKFITWYSIGIMIVGFLIALYSKNVKGVYILAEGSEHTDLGVTIGSWLALNIVLFRNAKGFTKWIMTIFGYILLFSGTFAIIRYLVSLI